MRRLTYSKRSVVYTIFILIVGGFSILILYQHSYKRMRAGDPDVTVLPESVKTIAFGTRLFLAEQWYDANIDELMDCQQSCSYSEDVETADAVLFAATDIYHHWLFRLSRPYKYPNQIWVVHSWESPWSILLMGNREPLGSYFDLFEGYQRDAQITNPYGRIKPRNATNENAISLPNLEQKTELAVAMISRCGDAGSGRWSYIEELQKHIPVTVYGKCGTLCSNAETCSWTNLGHRFKFYLSFENSLCKDYITEKFWSNGLLYNMVPIVLGGQSKEDYEKVAPPNSFIHVYDYQSPQELATYLKYLDLNHTAYMEYFQWKTDWTIFDGHRIMSERYCALCEYLHNRTKLDPTNKMSVGEILNVDTQCSKYESMNFM